MLAVTIIAVGKQKEPWQRQGTQEYIKRLGAYCRPEVVELAEYRLPENPAPAEVEQALAQEGRVIMQKLGRTPYVALCVEGEQLSSPKLARFLTDQQQRTGALGFVIGSSHGLAREVKEGAVLRLSMSAMTFPHQMFRVMLAEQLYRGFSIAAGGKYHK